VAFMGRVRFAGVHALSDRGMTIAFGLPHPLPHPRIRKIEDYGEEANNRIEELESLDTSLHQARVESAFWRAVAVYPQRITDHETALDLFLSRGFADLVKVSDDDGEIEGIDDAMAKLIGRYPWLSSGDGDHPRDDDIRPPIPPHCLSTEEEAGQRDRADQVHPGARVQIEQQARPAAFASR
jgi:hypothetical protein